MMATSTLPGAWQRLRNNVLAQRLLTVLSLDILVKASAVILLPVYLRLMTQTEYGIFNYLLSVVYSAATLLNLGLYIPQSKYYHDHAAAGPRGALLYKINILLFTGLLILVLPVYLLHLDRYLVPLLFRDPVDYDRYRNWLFAITVLSLFSFMLSNFFYTAEKIRSIRSYSLWRVAGINGISIAALLLFRSRDAILTRFIVMTTVEGILLIFYYRSYLAAAKPGPRPHPSRREPYWTGKLLKMGLPVMLSAVFMIIINFGDKYFLEKYSGFRQLPVYYLAFSCASVIPVISAALQNVWLPLFFKEKDLRRNLDRTRKLIFRMVLILLVLSLAVIACVGLCLRLSIIPASYHPIIGILPLLLAGQGIQCLALLYSNYLSYFERTAFIGWAGLLVSLISISGNIRLIPLYGIYGAAITLLIANTCYLIIYYLIFRYYRTRLLLTPQS